jgi:hypothetical protein
MIVKVKHYERAQSQVPHPRPETPRHVTHNHDEDCSDDDCSDEARSGTSDPDKSDPEKSATDLVKPCVPPNDPANEGVVEANGSLERELAD